MKETELKSMAFSISRLICSGCREELLNVGQRYKRKGWVKIGDEYFCDDCLEDINGFSY